jgi:hypothetical protein
LLLLIVLEVLQQLRITPVDPQIHNVNWLLAAQQLLRVRGLLLLLVVLLLWL